MIYSITMTMDAVLPAAEERSTRSVIISRSRVGWRFWDVVFTGGCSNVTVSIASYLHIRFLHQLSPRELKGTRFTSPTMRQLIAQGRIKQNKHDTTRKMVINSTLFLLRSQLNVCVQSWLFPIPRSITHHRPLLNPHS